MPKRWFRRLAYKHRVLDDTIEQGALFCNMLAENIGDASVYVKLCEKGVEESRSLSLPYMFLMTSVNNRIYDRPRLNLVMWPNSSIFFSLRGFEPDEVIKRSITSHIRNCDLRNFILMILNTSISA
jgi:hypothetical protein